MNKHVNGVPACPSCEDKLKDAHAELGTWFRDKVKPHFPQAHISWSYRDKQNQEDAFLDGKSKLHFPLSDHNKSDDEGSPCAMALDLFQLDHNGMGCWPWGFFRDIAKTAGADHEPILWGGTWHSLGDADHFSWRPKDKHS